MEQFIEKAEVLVEALPYITRFKGNIVIIKYGGSAMLDDKLKESVIKDIVLLEAVGIQPVIVHGGGSEINILAEKLGIKSQFVQGLRITDEQTVEIVEMVLVGKVNRMIVGMINEFGGKAVGISGKDAGLITAKKKPPVTVVDESGIEKTVDLGLVGGIEDVNPQIILTLVKEGYIPVIAPTAASRDGTTYNINADTVAGSIARNIKANKLIILSDQRGILREMNNEDSLIPRIEIGEIDELVKTGIIDGGGIPKIYACKNALMYGVKEVHIIDGRLKHSLLLEIFTNQGIGTMIYKKEESS
ncbi:MAG: acetylglutamate kinase [Candidatus Hydrogenedentota bacterium]